MDYNCVEMSYIIVSEYLCDCIGHVNRVSQKKEEVGRNVQREEEEGREGMKCSLVGAQEIKII